MVTETDELTYCGKDPGAVKFGNFINYYSFHNSSERIENLHMSMFPTLNADEDIVCLDIGCNTGELTKEIYEYLKNVIYPKTNIHILAIDIDPTLIQRANEQINIPNIIFVKSNILNEEGQKVLQQFLNLHRRRKFDIIFCFSVTMWLHINNGDEKFLQFLDFINKVTRALIIEPHPWKCYRKAQRRMAKTGNSFPLYKSLTIRSDVESVIEEIIIKNGLTKIYESQRSSWNRKIQSYHI
ncbi:probable RNA methyltransferase CG11342 [Battus philenor]|uniref:probable RNA methyltransferase CG11342 n=1 Tax=Battus philenor TaxID=42288 RepID=UPI0035D0D9B3